MNRRQITPWLTAVLMLFSSCSGSQETADVVDGSKTGTNALPLNLSVSTGMPGRTRSVTTEDLQNTSFRSGQQIDIFIQDAHTGSETKTVYSLPLTFTTGDLNDAGKNILTGHTLYWPALEHGINVYGVFPSGIVDEHALDDSKTYSFSVSANQSAFGSSTMPVKEDRPDGTSDEDWAAYEAQYAADCDAAQGYRGSDLMIGKPTGDNPVSQPAFDEAAAPVNITFIHMLSKVIVNIEKTDATDYTDGQLACARVTILNTRPAATFSVTEQTAVVDNTVAAVPIIARETVEETDNSDPNNPVTTTLYTGKSVAAVIVPQTVAAGDFIQIEVGEDTYIYSLPAARTFTSGNVYTFTITVHKASITVTSTINPWYDGVGEADEDEHNQTGNGYLQ